MSVSTVSIVFVAVAWAAVGLSLWPLLRLLAPYRHQRRLPELNSKEEVNDVTVVVLADRNPEGLSALIERLKTQREVERREIIIACDPTSDHLVNTIKQIKYHHPDVYVTYVPDETRNVSRRKLAVYLGVKAARNEKMVLVTSDTIILSDYWLKSVVSAFSDNCQVVISPVSVTSVPGKGFGRYLRKLDYVLRTLTWVNAAMRSHCFRGSSHNLAYTRSLFFENKGFANSLNYHYGDDDIFISEISTHDNTSVNLYPEGLTMQKITDVAAWEKTACARRFTLQGLGRGARFVTELLWFSGWLCLVSAALAIIFGAPELLPVLLGAGAPVAFIATSTAILCRAARFLRLKLPWSIMLPEILSLPALGLARMIRMRRNRDSYHTWKKLR